MVHTAVLLFEGLNPDEGTADAIVVLGNKVEISGVPSQRLRDRLDKAVELFKENRAKCIIVSGAVGKEGHDEALVMREYLIRHGVPAKSVIADGKGINTRATARFAGIFFKEHKYRRAIVVSQYYHILRCKMALRQKGIPVVLDVAADFNMELREPMCLFREFLAYYYYLARGSV